LTDFAIGNEVIRIVQIKLVDFFLRHELVDLDCTLALNSDGFEFFGLDLDVLPFADLGGRRPKAAKERTRGRWCAEGGALGYGDLADAEGVWEGAQYVWARAVT
jgi:hypothetical protein